MRSAFYPGIPKTRMSSFLKDPPKGGPLHTKISTDEIVGYHTKNEPSSVQSVGRHGDAI